ncbi:hypothetical protein HA402_003740 [Bradysia odoriphaga]|nr:hypothetical protein HA402_003740 [Bradysia odoriphaga]
MNLNQQNRPFIRATAPPPSPPPPYDHVNEELNQSAERLLIDRGRHIKPENDAGVSVPSSNGNGYYRLKKLAILALVVIITTAAASLITFYIMVAYGHLKQYGKKCSPAEPMSCGTTDLICLNSGVCGCKSSDYKWDHDQEVCVALVNTDAECRKWGWDGSYAIPCTANAFCSDDHRCKCLHYFAAVEHECIATYDGICSSSKDCNQQEFLYCGKSGKCECRPGTVRSQKGNEFGCFVKIGETCSGIMQNLCVDPHSECSKEEKCRCNNGYIPSNENTRCGKPANGTCFADRDCADTLSCQKTVLTDQAGLCLCRSTEIFDDTDDKCRIKAGKRCDVTDKKQCADNAICKRSTCTCNRGYGLDEASGLCLGTHGTVCESNAECLGSHYFQCSDGICGCDKNHTHYSEATGSCFGNVTDTVCFNDLNCDQQRMYCEPIEKRCTCSVGFKEDNRLCYGEHGTGCAVTGDCFAQEMLTCLEGHCGCNAAFEEWDDNECKLQFNQRCEVPGNRNNMKCVGNLTCLVDQTHVNDVFKICGCESKYIVSEDKRDCINIADSVHSSLAAILLMTLVVKYL